MKKVILAFDSFKGSVGSLDIARCVRQVILKEYPHSEVVCFPVADGGEGTTEAICNYLDTTPVSCTVHDPLMNRCEVSYGITTDRTTAVLEMASSSGLTLVPVSLRNPMYTSTFGTGEVIADALERGCRKFIVGIGGSATNDGGIGMLQALGVRFLDKQGYELEAVGCNLIRIQQIDDSAIHPALKESSFTIICDVKNHFYGPEGAAFIFAPQKGATADEVMYLDRGLRHYADLIQREKGIDIAHIAGAGAGGGIGGGFLSFLNTTLKPGIDTILEILHFREAIQGADLIFTGEGKLDAQTAMGKALGGILKIAHEQNAPVIALGGSIEATAQLNEMGFTAVFPIQPFPVTLEQAMQYDFTIANIERTVTQILHVIKRFGIK